jgi:hypothetical protein
MSTNNNVIPLTRKPKPAREPWRDNWELAYTVSQLLHELAQAPPNARVYVRHVRLGMVGVGAVDSASYTGPGGGCYGQPTVMLYLNDAELTPAPDMEGTDER